MRSGFALLSCGLLVLASGACSGSAPADEEGVGGTGIGSGGRRGSGGTGSPGSGSRSPTDGGGAGEPGDGGAGGGASGGGGRRGSGGTGPQGSGGDTPGDGGSEAGSGGNNPGSCEEKSPPSQGQHTIDVDGSQRGYYLIPSNTKERVPLVISFHGWGGKGEWDVGTFLFNYASEGKAVLMYPDGVQQDWAGGVGWDTRGSDTPDIHLVEQLIAEASESHCIDESKIFVVGFSWGGWMATQAACVLGDRIRGFISVAGGGPMQAQCGSPVAGMIVHGTADTAEPIASGRSSLESWLTDNGCGEDSTGAFDGACVSYSGCEKPTLWCAHPGEHIIPPFIYEVGWSFLMDAP